MRRKLSTILAQQEFQRLYRIAPDSARVHQLMAELHHVRGDAVNEEREYRAALEREPNLIPALTGLGDLERERNQCTEAVMVYSKAAALAPRDYDALYGQAACAVMGRDYAKAIPLLRQAVEIDPGSKIGRAHV